MKFTSEFEHSIDAKHRLAIPADLRNVMEQAGYGNVLYLIPWEQGSIWMFPEPVFDRLAERFSDIMSQGEEAMEFESILFPLARRVEIDSAGRIRIPQAMLEESGLTSSVVILGRNDRMEICSPEKWAAQRADKRQRLSEFFNRTRHEIRSRAAQPGPENGT